MAIKLPTNFVPRDYQLPVWESMVMKKDKSRGLLVWPRRHGKDLTCLNILAMRALLDRVGNYYYFAPTYAQGKKIIWDGKDRTGRPFLSVFPGYPNTKSDDPQSVIAAMDKREMKIHLTNGSMFQVIGIDDEDSLVGTNPVGCVFSEYSVMRGTKAWDLVRPILAENGGWALFTYTARGLNHGWRLYELTKDDPEWHTEFHTVNTALHDGQRVITDEDIEKERRSGMTDDLIAQEFYNDFYASNTGAYYSTQMKLAKEEGRIGSVPWQPDLPVHTAWDLGMRDSTAIWFFQTDHAGNVNLIDTYSDTGVGIANYIKVLRQKPYTYGTHFAPHDIKIKEFGNGKSRLSTALSLGLRFNVVAKLLVQDGIDAARAVLPRCRFDEKKCFKGLEALRQYRKKETGMTDLEGRAIFSNEPEHDWSSHYADAFRYLAVAIDQVLCNNGYVDSNGRVVELPDHAVSEYDMFNGF